jgi:hypothetical protein
MWGGIGLVMATPLTVCFVVMARHVPSLEWVEILMGDNPKVRPWMVLYQRLLAGDETEASEFLDAELRKKSPMEVLDETVLPAIALAKRESTRDRLSDDEEQLLHDAVLRVMPAPCRRCALRRDCPTMFPLLQAPALFPQILPIDPWFWVGLSMPERMKQRCSACSSCCLPDWTLKSSLDKD